MNEVWSLDLLSQSFTIFYDWSTMKHSVSSMPLVCFFIDCKNLVRRVASSAKEFKDAANNALDWLRRQSRTGSTHLVDSCGTSSSPGLYQGTSLPLCTTVPCSFGLGRGEVRQKRSQWCEFLTTLTMSQGSPIAWFAMILLLSKLDLRRLMLGVKHSPQQGLGAWRNLKREVFVRISRVFQKRCFFPLDWMAVSDSLIVV